MNQTRLDTSEHNVRFGGVLRISRWRESQQILQITWLMPECKDDDGRVRTPKGWMWWRFWEHEGKWNLSQGIKGLLGSGDMRIRRDLILDQEKIKNLSPDDLCEVLMDLIGDFESPLERSYTRKRQ